MAENNDAPIYDPDRAFRVWKIDEIYGEYGGRYIPNVNDAVWDWDNGLYRVTAINIETGESTLDRYTFTPTNPGIDSDDILLGSVPGRASEAFRLYVNDTTDPITAVAESRLFIYGSDNEYIRYFKGFDISDRGEVVSLYYDDNNNLKDDKIPLELVNVPDSTNRAIKTPMSGYISKTLEDGEVVTCVVYGSAGMASSVNPLLVKNTAYIRGVQMAVKYITGITISSPFLKDEENGILEVPRFTSVQQMNIKVNVHYSDGDIVTVAPDNKKVIVEGIETFNKTQIGRTIDFSVIYTFGENEESYSANADSGKSLTKNYKITTLDPLDTGVVKIFTIPKWNVENVVWELKFYLHNLHRDINKDITEFVDIIEPAGKGFDPKDFGVLQRLKYSFDTKNISETESDYVYEQDFQITIFSTIDQQYPTWTFTYIDKGDILYGENQIAKYNTVSGKTSLDISQGLSDLNTWLDLMYTPLYPLLQLESVITTLPTHVILNYRDKHIEVTIEEALSPIDFDITPRLGATLTLTWFVRTEASDLYLATSPLTLRR